MLIETGVAAFKEPEAYSVSRHQVCVYRILGQKAREAKLGNLEERLVISSIPSVFAAAADAQDLN